MIYVICRERERERERITEKFGVVEVFGTNEKNFKRSLWHLWRDHSPGKLKSNSQKITLSLSLSLSLSVGVFVFVTDSSTCPLHVDSTDYPRNLNARACWLVNFQGYKSNLHILIF